MPSVGIPWRNKTGPLPLFRFRKRSMLVLDLNFESALISGFVDYRARISVLAFAGASWGRKVIPALANNLI
jgi:hypothetical protein